MSTVQGLDISSCQSGVDFKKVRSAGYSFVILRLNEWDRNKKDVVMDSEFDEYYKAAKAAGLGVGAYWFTYANTVDYVKYEADTAVKWLKGRQLDYPVWFDLEREEQFSQGMSFCDQAVKTFCDTLEKAGWFTGVYCSTYWYTKCVSAAVRERYACWIAEWSSKCSYTGSYGMWQNGTARVSGISGDVDHDYCYTDYPSIIKSAGLNGYQTPSGSEKLLDSGSCYKLGETTVGALAVKELLRLACDCGLTSVKVNDSKTYDADAVKAVKALQKAWGCQQTGRAGANFVRKLYAEIKKKL
ncbi:MAG: glycoside hydrolase [Ruminococcus sp.]|nr:glycoside hydrolase [Ruminococcus sp.]